MQLNMVLILIRCSDSTVGKYIWYPFEISEHLITDACLVQSNEKKALNIRTFEKNVKYQNI